MTEFESDIRVEFDDHPAMEVVAAYDGGPVAKVPMFPDQRLVRLNGRGVAYLSLKSGGLSFMTTVHKTVERVVVDKCKEYFKANKVEAEVVPSQPPQVIVEEE